MSQRMWVVLESGKGKETEFPIEPPVGSQPCYPFRFSPVRSIFRLLTYKTKITSICCFKLLNSW